MKNMSKCLVIMAVFVLFVSCSSTKSIQKTYLGSEHILMPVSTPITLSDDSDEESTEPVYDSFEEVLKDVEKTKDNATSGDVALLLLSLDKYEVSPEDEESFYTLKYDITKFLRTMIENEIEQLCSEALTAPTGNKALEIMSEAQNRFFLYPYLEDEETKKGINSIKKQFESTFAKLNEQQMAKYSKFVESQINSFNIEFNNISSYLSPIEENGKLMNLTVETIGRINTKYLSGEVIAFYNSLIAETKDQISEKEGLELDEMLKNTKKTDIWSL